MKFVSKMSNLRIILRPGIQSNHMTGSPAVPTLYVQFKDGLTSVEDPELAQRMLNHPDMDVDFVRVDDGDNDPYSANRTPETVHVTSEVENGRVVSRSNSPTGPSAKSLEIQRLVEERAKAIAMEMLPELLKSLAASNTASPDKEADKKEEEVDLPKTAPAKPKAAAKVEK